MLFLLGTRHGRFQGLWAVDVEGRGIIQESSVPRDNSLAENDY